MTDKKSGFMDPLVANSKIENYRLRANSLLGSSRRQSNGNAVDCALTIPQWDIDHLEHESEELVTRASIRVKKLKSVFSHMGVLKWVKKWKNIRKAELVNVELDNFFPKLKDTEEDIKTWLEALQMQKSLALITGDQLISKIQANIARYEARLNNFDDLENDCLQINYDVNQLASESLQALAFNEEVLTLSHCSPLPHGSKNKVGASHTNKAHRHSASVSCATRTQCKSISGSINKCKNIDSPSKELPLTSSNLQLLNQASPMKSHPFLSPPAKAATATSSSDEDSDGKCSNNSAEDTECGAKENASCPLAVLAVAESAELFPPPMDPLEPAVWHNMHNRNLNCKIGLVPTYNLPRKLSGPKLLPISSVANTGSSNNSSTSSIPTTHQDDATLNISHDKVGAMDLNDKSSALVAASKESRIASNNETMLYQLFCDDKVNNNNNNNRMLVDADFANDDGKDNSNSGVVIASESVASTDSMTTSNSDKDSSASIEDIVIPALTATVALSNRSLLNPESVLSPNSSNNVSASSFLVCNNVDSPSNSKCSFEPQKLLHLLLHENRENLTRQEEMDLQRYAHFLELKDLFQIQDNDYLELCSQIHRCHEIRLEGNTIIREIRMRKEFDKCVLKKNKCMLNELNKVCCKSTGVANSEADFFCRLPTDLFGCCVDNDVEFEEDLKGDNGATFFSSKRTKSKPSSNHKNSIVEIDNQSSHHRPRKNKLRSLRKSLNLDSIQKLLPTLFWSSETTATTPRKESKRLDSVITASGKSPKPTVNVGLCKIRTRSGKNLFQFPASTMTLEEAVAVTPKDDGSSVSGVAVSSSFQDLPMLDSCDDVQLWRLESNSNFNVSIDEHVNRSSLYKASLECVNDLKVILVEMEKAENSLQTISSLLEITCHVSNDLKEAESDLCK